MLFRSLRKYRPILWTVYLKPEQGPIRVIARGMKGLNALDEVEALRKRGKHAWAEPH